MKSILLAAILICSAGSAFADGTTIKNNSGIDIDHLYISPAGQKAYGNDLMAGAPAGSFDNGKIFTVPGLANGTYDFKLIDNNGGRNCVMAGIKVRTDKATTLTKKRGTFCQ